MILIAVDVVIQVHAAKEIQAVYAFSILNALCNTFIVSPDLLTFLHPGFVHYIMWTVCSSVD